MVTTRCPLAASCLALLCLLSPSAIAAGLVHDPIQDESTLLEQGQRAGAPACRRRCAATEPEAHRLAANAFLDIALQVRREVSWRVYELEDGSFTYSFPAVSPVGATSTRLPPRAPGLAYTSAGHVHWDEVVEFSPLDWQWVLANRRDLYLVSRERVLRVLKPSTVFRRQGSGLAYPRRAVSLPGRPLMAITSPALP